MRRLAFKPSMVADIITGRKSQTLRRPRKQAAHNMEVGEQFLATTQGRPFALCFVTHVDHVTMSELDDDDARREGFEKADDLRVAVRKIYGRINALHRIQFRYLDKPEQAAREKAGG